MMQIMGNMFAGIAASINSTHQVSSKGQNLNQVPNQSGVNPNISQQHPAEPICIWLCEKPQWARNWKFTWIYDSRTTFIIGY